MSCITNSNQDFSLLGSRQTNLDSSNFTLGVQILTLGVQLTWSLKEVHAKDLQYSKLAVLLAIVMEPWLAEESNKLNSNVEVSGSY